jgi:hypothetical protein
MYKRLFQITIVLFLVVVTIVVLGLLISAVLNASSPGILAGAGGSSSYLLFSVSQKQLGYIIVAASLIVAGFYLFFRRSRFRR